MPNPAPRARSGSGVATVPRMSGRSSRLRPPSWALIISAVRTVVARSPNNAHPAQSMSVGRHGVVLGGEGAEDMIERLPASGDALVLECLTHAVHVHAGVCDGLHDAFGICHVDVDRPRKGAVVLERADGVLRVHPADEEGGHAVH